LLAYRELFVAPLLSLKLVRHAFQKLSGKSILYNTTQYDDPDKDPFQPKYLSQHIIYNISNE
jgi:hypothetical protein